MGDTSYRRTIPAELGAALRRRRLWLGWSLRDAASAAGCSATLLWRIERAERCPSPEVAWRIADALDLDARLAGDLAAESQRTAPAQRNATQGPDGRST